MDSLPSFDASDKRRWLVLAGLVAVPMYVLPVGLWGLRGLRPRVLRGSVSTAITLGALSLIGLGVGSFARRKRSPPPPPRLACADTRRWKLPLHGPVMPEEFAASAASGY